MEQTRDSMASCVENEDEQSEALRRVEAAMVIYVRGAIRAARAERQAELSRRASEEKT